MDDDQSSSLKMPWGQNKRDRFERHLHNLGWTLHQQLKRSTIYAKGTMRIEVDAWGCWLFEAFRESGMDITWPRTHGLSDDRCDQIFSIGHDANILPFKHGRMLKRLNLGNGAWVK